MFKPESRFITLAAAGVLCKHRDSAWQKVCSPSQA
jgi:hypothetical protein